MSKIETKRFSDAEINALKQDLLSQGFVFSGEKDVHCKHWGYRHRIFKFDDANEVPYTVDIKIHYWKEVPLWHSIKTKTPFHEIIVSLFLNAKAMFDIILAPWNHLKADITTDEDGESYFTAQKYCYSAEEIKEAINEMETLANFLWSLGKDKKVR